MSDDTSGKPTSLIDRLLEGDLAARNELIAAIYPHLRRRAAARLHGAYPRLKARGHDTDSVADEAVLRIIRELQSSGVKTPAAFLVFAASRVGWVLGDMARAQSRRDRVEGGTRVGHAGQADSSDGAPYEPADTRGDPIPLMKCWEAFHRVVDELPEPEKAVFNLGYYLGFSQEQIARVVALHPRKVSRLWNKALKGLEAWVAGAGSAS